VPCFGKTSEKYFTSGNNLFSNRESVFELLNCSDLFTAFVGELYSFLSSSRQRIKLYLTPSISIGGSFI